MRKVLVLLFVLLLALAFCACDMSGDVHDINDKPIIVLPDKETAETVNGYRPKNESSEESSNDAVSSTSSISFDEALIVGNKNSLKYHAKDCRYATQINEDNLALFKSADEAIKEGYKACGVCFKK